MTKEKWKDDVFLDQFIVSKADTGLRLLVESVASTLMRLEERQEKRKRKRKETDLRRLTANLDTVVSNLAYFVLRYGDNHSGYVAASRRKGRKLNRYDNSDLGPKALASVLDMLERGHMLEQQKGAVGTGLTRIRPTSFLKTRIARRRVEFSDFTRLANEEVVVVSYKTKHDHKSKAKRHLVDYEETERSRQVRSAVKEMNHFLDMVEIGFVDDGGLPRIDPYQRRLKRMFNLTDANDVAGLELSKGGRLFGGFWQNLKKRRRKNIIIQGESPALVDFSSMFPRLAYAKVGCPVPLEGDLYDLSGFMEDSQRLKRDKIKKIFNALLNGASGRRKVESMSLPEGVTMPMVTHALRTKHPEMGRLFGTQIGLELMYEESEILVRVLQELRQKDVVALPIHDAILVAKSKATEATEVMERVANDFVGHAMPTTVKAY